MPTTPHPVLRRGRATAGIVAVAAALVLLASACKVPEPASKAWAAYKANRPQDLPYLDAGMKATLFAKPYKASDEWIFLGCAGSGETTCDWVDRTDTRLSMFVVEYHGRIEGLSRSSVASGVAGRMFHEWRQGDAAGATPYATTTARNALFGRTYSSGARWLPSGCDGVAGGQYCTWTSTDGHELRLKVATATNKVVEVVYDPA